MNSNTPQPFQLVEQDAATTAKIQALEDSIANTVSIITHAKLEWGNVKILGHASSELIAAMTEHNLATSTLKWALIKAKNNRIVEIKRGK